MTIIIPINVHPIQGKQQLSLERLMKDSDAMTNVPHLGIIVSRKSIIATTCTMKMCTASLKLLKYDSINTVCLHQFLDNWQFLKESVSQYDFQ